MKTFYSILSVVINHESSEKISLGLLLSNGNKSIFNFSSNRLSLINSLVNKETKQFISYYLKSIESVIKNIDKNQDNILNFEKEKNLILNESYIKYLSIYNQNLISFSNPTSIDVSVKQDIFKKLFERFIDEETVTKTSIQKNINIVKAEFYPKVEKHFSIEKEFTHKDYPEIILPISIDLFGKNEQYVIGHFLDLEKNINHIKNDYYDYNQLTKIFSEVISFTGRIISKYPQQYHFWNEIRKRNAHTYIDISEIQKVEEYAIIHNVQPIL